MLSVTVGTWNVNKPGELAWYDYSNFFGLEGTGDFTLNWKFKNYNPGDGNWRNFAIAVTTDKDRTTENADDWYLRADAYSNAVFGGGNEKVTYEFDWNWEDSLGTAGK